MRKYAKLTRSHIAAHEKSVVVNGTAIYPLTSPEAVAAQLREIIAGIEDRAYREGQQNMRAALQLLVGVNP